MGKKYDDDENSEYYDEEISIKAVGKLIDGFDEFDKEKKKPVVKAVGGPEVKESRKETISTSFYDEERGKRQDNEDKIVTGFKENDEEYEDYDEYEEGEQEETQVEEEPEEVPVRTRSRKVRSEEDELPPDRAERERYRRQFLDGYTDVRRKGLDLTQNGDYRKQSSADEPVKRVSGGKEGEGATRRRPRPRPADEDYKVQQAPARGRKVREEEEEISIIPRRTEQRRREKVPAASTTYSPSSSSSNGYDAPIFKVLAGVFVLMLVLMVFFVFKFNSANKEVKELTAKLEEMENNAEKLASAETENAALKQQVSELKDQNNSYIFQIQDLQSQTTVPGTTPSESTGGSAPQTQSPTGSSEYTVVSGDSLSKISNHFYGNTSGVDLIKQANNLSGDNLQVGQTLIIPARQ
ncbi:LysM peptidoglycan-binding domain-containing protein [Tyzzerella sp. OttesenSCG-928-J15]|nr:LysM peptidoglycan-binding domain-containing protein [Tyzzerella sp. OttesenSCG-928-J15]